MRNIFTIVFFSLATCAHASTDTTYLDQNKKKCDRAGAKYYRVYTRTVDNKYKVESRLITGNTLVLSAFCTTPDSASYEGSFTGYYDNGQKEKEGIYYNNGETGLWKYYYENGGSLWYTCTFSNGTPEGELTSYYASGEVKRREMHKRHNKQVKGKCFDKQGNEITYTPFQVMPQAPYDISKYLAGKMEYPETSRLNSIEGRVVLSFAINEQGTITRVEVARNLSPETDTEALRVVSAMPPWKPGLIDDKPVEVLFKLPIVFKLK